MERKCYIPSPNVLDIAAPHSILRAGLHYGGEVHRSWKKGHFSIVIGRKCNSWPVGVYTKWRKQWRWTFLMDDKMTWPPTWRHFLGLGFSRGEVFCPASRGRTRKSSSGEAQLNKNILLPLILLRHIHHLPHRTMSWPSILDRLDAFSTVVQTGPNTITTQT